MHISIRSRRALAALGPPVLAATSLMLGVGNAGAGKLVGSQGVY